MARHVTGEFSVLAAQLTPPQDVESGARVQSGRSLRIDGQSASDRNPQPAPGHATIGAFEGARVVKRREATHVEGRRRSGVDGQGKDARRVPAVRPACAAPALTAVGAPEDAAQRGKRRVERGGVSRIDGHLRGGQDGHESRGDADPTTAPVSAPEDAAQGSTQVEGGGYLGVDGYGPDVSDSRADAAPAATAVAALEDAAE